MKYPNFVVPNRGSSFLRKCGNGLLLAHLTLLPLLHSQEEDEEEEPYELSPFVVDGSQDQGYRAENTLAGSRMNMSLDDVAQSVNVLTTEFLEDVGAENIDDILQYAVNAEENYGDLPTGLVAEGNVGTTLNFSANGRVNMRGNTASVTVDNNEGGGSIDTYNTSRIDISQGPNAVLFGFGGAGGGINLSTQRANTLKDSFKIQSTIGSYDQFRNIVNFNKSLIDGKLGFKVISLNETAGGWRAGEDKETQRNTFILTFNPFKGTEIRASYEKGHVDTQFTVKQGAVDNWLEWDAVWDTEEYAALYGGGTYGDDFNPAGDQRSSLNAFGLVRGNNSRRKVYIDNLDFAAEGLPTDAGNLLPITHFSRTQALVSGRMLSDEEVDIAAFSPFGADSFQNEDIENTRIALTQRLLPNLFLNLEYFDSNNSARRISPTGRNLTIQADPNKVFDGIVAASPFDNMENPFGPTEDSYYLYSETQIGDYSWFINNHTYRASLGYKLDTERWGTHRFNLAVNQQEKSSKRVSDIEIVDVRTAYERGVNLSLYDLDGTNLTNARNRVWRRHYYEAGEDGYPVDDSEISVGAFFDPVSLLVEDGDGNELLLGSTWVPQGSGHRREVNNATEGSSFTMVNKWFKNRLTTTVGFRNTDVETRIYGGLRANAQIIKDDDGNIVYNEDGSIALLDEAAREYIYLDPFTGEPVSNNASYWFQSSTATDEKDSSATNRTLGVVYKATDWMSFVYNESNNRSDPSIFREVIPGVVAPSGDGTGMDLGVRLNLFDKKVSINMNYFENERENSFVSASVAENLLEPHRTVWNAFADVQDGVEYYLTDDNGELILDDGENPILDEDRTNSPLAESDPRYISLDEQEERNVTGGNQTLIDKKSTGYDIRIIANPTKNWRLSFNFSELLSSANEGLYEEDLVWMAGQRADAVALYDAYVAAGDGYAEDLFTALLEEESRLNEFFVVEADRLKYANLVDQGDLAGANELLASLHPVERVYDYAAQEAAITKYQVEEINTGSSAKKANMFTSYRFRQGNFKGLSVGGGFSWRDKRTLNHFFNYVDEETGEITKTSTPSAALGEADFLTIHESNDDFRLNLMASFSTKLKFLGRDAKAKFQLNVNNVLQSDYQFEPLRYDVDGTIRRYTIIGPRNWKFSTTIEF
ncbi:TonB-dependent receptor plug domain-containing protein [Puniceicoccaceae bacterium K14]|nr:TonB-dependent receptor plug domain-containing protein [Puniceicoccaceae bacterium K14]